MLDRVPADGEERIERDVDRSLELAALRTQLSWDRTLLAWVRTSLTLMGAAVAFAKGAQLLHEAKVLAGVEMVRSGHLLGLTLTGVSTLLLSVVCWQYVAGMRALSRIKSTRIVTPTLLVSLLVVLLGCGVFAVLMIDKGYKIS